MRADLSRKPWLWDDACREKARLLRVVALDVDGVMTDGGIFLSDGGEESKRFYVRDGMGIRLLRESGLVVGLVTARLSALVERRARELGLAFWHQGIGDKWAVLSRELEERGIAAEHCAFMGDDLVDLPVLTRVGLAAAPADAAAEVVARVHWVSGRRGGRGAVRELAEHILRARGEWDGLVARWENGVGSA
ncbi:MAG: phenylphosphate carboxylase subunit delta [Magnetococcales bacterium]|nr:phenylphosphate carboxylase subunit delta [Magnetococcales bacterium]